MGRHTDELALRREEAKDVECAHDHTDEVLADIDAVLEDAENHPTK